MSDKAERPAGGWIPSSRYDAFISYSRIDAQFAQDLRDRLEAGGKDVWMDLDDIPKGVDWREQIARGMALADNFIFILSPDSVGSKVCHEEIDLAVGRNKRILPVVARKVRYRDAHPEMSKINFFVPDERGFDGTAADVLRAIETDVDHAQAHTMLLAKAMDWDANDRNRGFLIKGEQLRKAEDWLAAAPKYAEPTPTALHAEYIKESRRAVTRFTRLVFASVAAFLVVSLVLSLISLAERNERLKTARAGYLALTSDELAPRDPTLALDLAVRALDLNPANKRAATLLQRLFHESVTRPLYASVDRESSDGDAALAMFGGDPFARDAGTLPTPRAGQAAARYTWDGRYVYGWSSSIGEFEFEERAVEVQSLAGDPVLTTSGSLIEKLPTNPEPVVVPSPDGQWLYIAAGSGGELFRSDGQRVAGVDIDELPESANIEVVEDRGGERVVRGQGWQCITAPSSSAGGVIPSTERISAAAFSPDGRRLAVAYFDFFRRVRMAFFDIDANGQPNLDVQATACFQWSGEGAP
ncbi:MAG: toll/interleukin-1 receptor domain-containing protein, partial [Woeseia sp.]